jgi:hypothetical protein
VGPPRRLHSPLSRVFRPTFFLPSQRRRAEAGPGLQTPSAEGLLPALAADIATLELNPDWAKRPLFDKAYGYIRQYY